MRSQYFTCTIPKTERTNQRSERSNASVASSYRKRHIGKSGPIVKANSRIELENQERVENAFNYVLELDPQPTDPVDKPSISDLPSGDAFTNKSHSGSKSNSNIIIDPIVGAIISSDN